MAQHTEIYRRALAYDIVFRRDVARELDFLVEASQQFAGRTPSGLLDIACGPGYHARAWARRGLPAFGLDLTPDIIQYAASRCSPDEQVRWQAGDMRDFDLDAPVDVAICAYDSIDAMVTNDDLTRHFQAVARNLSEGGLYLVECIHPRECSPFRYGTHRHRGRDNGTAVELTIGVNHPRFDVVTGVGEVEFEMRILENDTERIIRDRARERLYSPQLFELLAERSHALKVAGWFGDFSLGQPLDNSRRSTSMLALFQKL